MHVYFWRVQGRKHAAVLRRPGVSKAALDQCKVKMSPALRALVMVHNGQTSCNLNWTEADNSLTREMFHGVMGGYVSRLLAASAVCCAGVQPFDVLYECAYNPACTHPAESAANVVSAQVGDGRHVGVRAPVRPEAGRPVRQD